MTEQIFQETIKEWLRARMVYPEENTHWIGGSDDLDIYDEGNSYCASCCQKRVNEINAEIQKFKHTAFVNGGWVTREETPQFCEDCGKPLAYELVDGREELEHFAEHAENINLKDGQVCYELYQVLDCSRIGETPFVEAEAKAKLLNKLLDKIPEVDEDEKNN